MMERPFSSETEGKEWFISWLKKHRFQDILDTDVISEYYHWDVEATLNGRRYAFELKNRNHKSSWSFDTVVNKYKYDYLVDCPYESVLVTFFEDCFVLIRVKNRPPDNYIVKECSRHTWFKDKTLFDNKMARWDIQNMHLLSYNE